MKIKINLRGTLDEEVVETSPDIRPAICEVSRGRQFDTACRKDTRRTRGVEKKKKKHSKNKNDFCEGLKDVDDL